jgi:invasion protein IalB
MTVQPSCNVHSLMSPLLLVLLMVPLLSVDLARGQQIAQATGVATDQKPSGEFALRGQRAARKIKYGDWRKVCFKVPETKMVCRTSLSGTFETGQTAVRLDLIEKDGEPAVRLQLFLPVGLYLQDPAKITVDKGSAYRVPYMWCLTNTCIAADVADPRLIKEMEEGEKLLLEVVDSSVLSVSTSLPLNQFSAVHRAAAAQTFEQTIDE